MSSSLGEAPIKKEKIHKTQKLYSYYNFNIIYE